jgi:hypothetical protein
VADFAAPKSLRRFATLLTYLNSSNNPTGPTMFDHKSIGLFAPKVKRPIDKARRC